MKSDKGEVVKGSLGRLKISREKLEKAEVEEG